jgi:SAM-dependent methyltransferase
MDDNKSSISDAQSYEEIGEFWDKHDISDYWEQTRPVEFEVDLEGWEESASRMFIDYGRYFVPERETQINIISDLISATEEPFRVLELCCGEGLLAGAILERYPGCTVYGYDGSAEVRQQALAIDGHEKAFDYFVESQWNIYHHPDPMDKPSPLSAQLKWLEQAGFAKVDVFWLQAGHAVFGGWKRDSKQ